MPNASTGPAMVKILAPTPVIQPSALNSTAGLTTELAKPVIGTSVPAPALAASFLVPARHRSDGGKHHQCDAGQCSGKVFIVPAQVELAQGFAQQADGPAHEKGPQAVLDDRAGRVGPLDHGVIIFGGSCIRHTSFYFSLPLAFPPAVPVMRQKSSRCRGNRVPAPWCGTIPANRGGFLHLWQARPRAGCRSGTARQTGGFP